MVKHPAEAAGQAASFAGFLADPLNWAIVFMSFYLVSGVARRLLSLSSPHAGHLGDEWISRLTPFLML